MNFLTAEVDVKVDDRGLSSQLARVKRSVTSAAGRIESSFKRLAGGAFKKAFSSMVRYAKWSSLALAGVGIASVKMAMDVEEAENLFIVSMGNMANATRQWSEELANRLKTNAYDLRRMVSTFNVMLDSMGLAPSKAAEVSQALTQLTYDMASFYNLSPEAAFQKLQAGISGEAEPLKRLGILVNETTAKQYALNQGWVKGGEQLSEVGKVMARVGVIMEQTTKAQGDMERTMDSTTNVIRSLWAQLKLMAIILGSALLPAVNKAAVSMRDLLFENKGRAAASLISVFEKMFMVIHKVGTAIHKASYYWQVFKTAIVKVKLELLELQNTVYSLPLMNANVDFKYLTKLREEIFLTRREISMMTKEAGETYSKMTDEPTGALRFFKSVREGLKETIEELRTSAQPMAEEDNRPSGLKIGFENDDSYKKATEASEKAAQAQKATWQDFTNHMKQWAFEAMDYWSRLGDTIVSSLDAASSALTNFVVKGKADFNSLAESILMDLTNMIVKGMLAQALGIALPGIFGMGGALNLAPVGTSANPMVVRNAPTLDSGGLVTKTGLAVVHRGEEYSGVGSQRRSQNPVTVNINVNNIDAAGTYQFLKKNKKTIASMINSEINNSNHPLGRNRR